MSTRNNISRMTMPNKETLKAINATLNPIGYYFIQKQIKKLYLSEWAPILISFKSK